MEVTSSSASIPVPEKDLLTYVLRHEAQKMLAQAIESVVAEWIDAHSQMRDEQCQSAGEFQEWSQCDAPGFSETGGAR